MTERRKKRKDNLEKHFALSGFSGEHACLERKVGVGIAQKHADLIRPVRLHADEFIDKSPSISGVGVNEGLFNDIGGEFVSSDYKLCVSFAFLRWWHVGWLTSSDATFELIDNLIPVLGLAHSNNTLNDVICTLSKQFSQA